MTPVSNKIIDAVVHLLHVEYENSSLKLIGKSLFKSKPGAVESTGNIIFKQTS